MVDRGRCPKHARQAEKDRGNSTERGYGGEWRRVRERFLMERCGECGDRPMATCGQCGGTGRANRFCGECLAGGKLAMATQVDHVLRFGRRPELRLERRNLQGLCVNHHELKSQAEQGRMAYSEFQIRKIREALGALGG